ncbi:MAG TPA: type I restriction enzyme HsdR N-terminal domain-containing protein [Chitinophagaceae bacterium]|nr:type I restriction enzyme HsdR N-terminal domain-containing protein [Chitinophagaceae bacterium]
MIVVNYPKHEFRFKKEDNKEFIFDEVRKQWLRLTPEEWVRQNFLQYLIQSKKYPAALIAIEKEIKLNDLKKRCDIVVYKNEKPWMIVECKEMNVTLNENTIKQILRYNMVMKVDYLIITNGTNIYAWHIADGNANEIDSTPDFI